MKKIIIFLLIISSFLPSITLAEVDVYSYTEDTIYAKVHTFETFEKCEADRLNFLEINKYPPIIKTKGSCTKSTVAGYPVVESEDAVAYIQPDRGDISVSENKTRYNFLVPIGNLKCMDWGVQTKDASGKTECLGNNIGDYLSIIFKIGVGLCAALAVIMLIIYGIVYMGEESIFGKTNAKNKMYGAILGLIIALGAWALLNTINPALTGAGGIMFDSVDISIEKEPLMKNDTFIEGITTNGCPEGIVTTTVEGISMPVCKSMEAGFRNMITSAKSAGIILSGYGYRSTQEQIRLRTENCGGVAFVYDTKAKCNPLTAIPGRSNHENGKAVDLKCDGVQIRATDNKCYVWLEANASKYGYKNLKSEPWHWSIDGR